MERGGPAAHHGAGNDRNPDVIEPLDMPALVGAECAGREQRIDEAPGEYAQDRDKSSAAVCTRVHVGLTCSTECS